MKLQGLPADNNGTYRCNEMRTWVFDVENDTTERIQKKLVAKTALKPDQLRVTRKLHNNQKNISQKQIFQGFYAGHYLRRAKW